MSRHTPSAVEALRELLIAVKYKTPPVDFGTADDPNPCYEARIPVAFVTQAEAALESPAPSPGASWSEERKAIREALGLFASAIKSGEGWSSMCEEYMARAKSALASLSAGEDQGPRAVPRLSHGEADEPIGYLFLNPDTGVEFSESHPVTSGEVTDAKDIRPATASNLLDELGLAWDHLAEYRAIATHPAVGGVVDRELMKEAWGALNFILAFYEPGQRHLDTNAWKEAEASGRRVHAKLRAFLDAAPAQTEAEPGREEIETVLNLALFIQETTGKFPVETTAARLLALLSAKESERG